MKKIVILLFLSFLTAVSCKKKDNSGSQKATVYFEYVYSNPQTNTLNGWFVESNGVIKGFDNMRTPGLSFREPDSTGLISETDMDYNISLADKDIVTISTTPLSLQYTSFLNVDANNISDKEVVSTGSGQQTFYGFINYPDTKTYKRIFLNTLGDYNQTNNSPDAASLIEYLNQVQQQVVQANSQNTR